jgi:hypothetical protein
MSNYYKNNKNMFPTTEIQCCRFHLGQSWWRKVQKLGLSKEYKEKDCDIGKWLASFIGLAEPRCSLLADYILKNYVASNSKFPPNLWVQLPSLDSKRTTNAAESFHAHYNEQFYAAHPTILAFLDVITKIQITTYIKIRTLHQPAVVRRSEMDKLTFLMEQYAKYQNGERNRHQYIKAIGFKYSARGSRIMFYAVLSCLYFYYIVKLYPAQNPTSSSSWCAGVTEITYKLTNFWRTEEVIL